MSLSEADLLELHLLVLSWCKWDMTRFDAWLDDPANWHGREHVHQQLHNSRETLRHVYKQALNEERIELYASNLRLSAKCESMFRAGYTLESKQAARTEQARKAGKLGGSKVDELREKIVDVLRVHRQDGRMLKEALRSWRQSGVEDGLRLEYRPDPLDDYVIDDENGFTAPRIYKYSGLEGMFADAGRKETGR